MIGAHKSTLDAKNRMNIPAKLREEIGNTFVLAKNIGEACIKIYSVEEWKLTMERINEKPQVQVQKIRRFLCGSAYEVTCDKQGRISVNSELIKYAGLTTDVTVVGTDGGAEIWNKEAWDKYCEVSDDDEVYSLALELKI